MARIESRNRKRRVAIKHYCIKGVVEGVTACNTVGLVMVQGKKNYTRTRAEVTCKLCKKTAAYTHEGVRL